MPVGGAGQGSLCLCRVAQGSQLPSLIGRLLSCAKPSPKWGALLFVVVGFGFVLIFFFLTPLLLLKEPGWISGWLDFIG